MSGAVRERPILFNGPMVRAILEGRKTQTRRVVKPLRGAFIFHDNRQMQWDLRTERWVLCPRGKAGERLWVRETWKPIAAFPPDSVPFGCEASSDNGWETEEWERPIPREQTEGCAVLYRATDDDDGLWRPSIHMPRWASRLTLEITDVRVERLQGINKVDAVAEGLCPLPPAGWQPFRPYFDFYMDPRRAFEHLWDFVNAKSPGCTWADNPWVWVISFRRVTP